MLSLIDSDGVLSRVKLSDLTGDWRLFTREQLHVAQENSCLPWPLIKPMG